jgi:hypothetical protein
VAEANRQFPEHKITEPGQGFVMASGLSALFLGLTAADYEDAVLSAVLLGKDTDTMAAIAGAIAGARWGEEGIPAKWLRGLRNAQQVGLRGDALCAREAEGLKLKELAAMEAELTRLEVKERAAFVAAMIAKGEVPPPLTDQQRDARRKPEEPKIGEAAPMPAPDVRRGKRQKPDRKKAPWKN